MTAISDLLWRTEFSDLPKPPDCDYWQFAAATKVKHDDIARLYAKYFVNRLRAIPARAKQDIEDYINDFLEASKL